MNNIVKNIVRVSVASLVLSAPALVDRMMVEGYTDHAVIPTKNDVPTFGFGSTYKEDGQRVKIGDKTDPVRAVRLALMAFDDTQNGIKQCLGSDVKLTQGEYDVYNKLAFNIGTFNFCTGGRAGQKSTIVKELQAGNYKKACDAILLWKKSGGYDCSIKGNKICSGVWKDRLKQHEECIKAGQ